MCADVVIVGGGPIGCWTAIQLKKRNPALDVQVYERYEEYQRDHMLSILKGSLQSYAKKTGDAPETAFHGAIAAADKHLKPGTDANGLRDVTYIRTLDFETILKSEAARLGVKFTYEKMETPDAVMARHPECRNFIAADGAHSQMRKALLGEDDVALKALLYSVDVKYEALGQAQYMHEPTFDKMDMIVIETVPKAAEMPEAEWVYPPQRQLTKEQYINHGMELFYRELLQRTDLTSEQKQEKGRKERARLTEQAVEPPAPEPVKDKTSVALRFLVDRKTYDAIPEATFKQPLDLKTVGNFADEITKFQKLRKTYTREQAIPGTEKISKVTLSQYASRKFAVPVKNNGQKAGWFFVGDAALGVPFYRSINSGLQMGSQLAAVVATKSLSPSFKSAAYNALRPVKMAREFGAVAAKLSGIRLYKNVLRPALRGLGAVGLGIVAVPFILAVGAYMAVNPKARMM